MTEKKNATNAASESAASSPAKLTGAEILWATLEGEGVREVFGYPGGAILPIYDALRKFPIKHILVRHEQGAVHMADGYARASGRVGVAMATSGPGATNMVTGIATAMLDSTPLICITGNVSSKVLGSDAFQEVDITGITMPVTKHNYLVTRAEDMPPSSAMPSAWQRPDVPARCSSTLRRTRSRPPRISISTLLCLRTTSRTPCCVPSRAAWSKQPS